MKTLSLLIASIFTFNVFACHDNFNGKFVDENAGQNILEIKVLDCSPQFEVNFPAESRTGHIIADNVDRLIWNAGGRKISERGFVKDDTLTVNIVDRHVFDTYYQNQIYKITAQGLDFYIEIFNTKRTYNYKKHINYVRE